MANNNKMKNSWRNEEDEFLRKHWMTMRASVIGHHLGRTKNSVVSRTRTLKLPSKKVPGTLKGHKTYKRDRSVKVIRRRIQVHERVDEMRKIVRRRIGQQQREERMARTRLRIARVTDEPELLPPVEGSIMDKVIALEPTHCRWPIGDAYAEDFQYCRHPRAHIHTQYCPYHHAKRIRKPGEPTDDNTPDSGSASK